MTLDFGIGMLIVLHLQLDNHTKLNTTPLTETLLQIYKNIFEWLKNKLREKKKHTDLKM